jgi:hypothetical protein
MRWHTGHMSATRARLNLIRKELILCLATVHVFTGIG